MNKTKEEYIALIQQFLNGSMTWQSFREAYDEKYLNDTRQHGEKLFNILDALFAEEDMTTDNPELLRIGGYLTPEQLQEYARQALEKLREL